MNQDEPNAKPTDEPIWTIHPEPIWIIHPEPVNHVSSFQLVFHDMKCRSISVLIVYLLWIIWSLCTRAYSLWLKIFGRFSVRCWMMSQIIMLVPIIMAFMQGGIFMITLVIILLVLLLFISVILFKFCRKPAALSRDIKLGQYHIKPGLDSKKSLKNNFWISVMKILCAAVLMFSCRNSDRLWSGISDAVSQLSASEEPSSKSSKDSGCYMPNEQQQCQRTAKTKNGTGRSKSNGRSQDSRFVRVENGKDIWMCSFCKLQRSIC